MAINYNTSIKKFLFCLMLLAGIATIAYAADQAINARTELAAAPAENDILPIYDTSTTSGKRITVLNLMKVLESAMTGFAIHQDNLPSTLTGLTFGGLTANRGLATDGSGNIVVTTGNLALGTNLTTATGAVTLTGNAGGSSAITIPNSTVTLPATPIGEGVATGGIVLGDSTPDADGEIGYASNSFLWFANSEDMKVTASANMWTWDSNTSAAFTFTPAVTVTGTFTTNGATNIGDGGDDIHILLKKTVSDGTWNGITVNLTCHETIAFGKPVFVNSDGEAALANATAASTMPAIGLAVVGGNASDTCTILVHGIVAEIDWTWTPGGTIYVDDSAAGVLTATVGDIAGTDHVVQVMGIALHADAMLVNPSLSLTILE